MHRSLSLLNRDLRGRTIERLMVCDNLAFKKLFKVEEDQIFKL
jgi:hypothetical protein